MAGIRWLRSHARVAVPAIVVATAVVTLAATIVHPDRIFFDEVYYVNDARDFLEFGVESGVVVHPPLGKLLIATGIWLFGDSPFGWRVVGALLAVVSVGLVYAMARRVGMRVAAAGLAGLALALDGVFIAQAHTAMLDIHLAFFVVLGAWALLRDRDHVRRADAAALAAAVAASPAPDRPATSVAASRPSAQQEVLAYIGRDQPDVEVVPRDDPADPAVSSEPPSGGIGTPSPPRTPAPERHLERLPTPHRWWLVLAGVSFGAGVAVKWSGGFALAAAGLVLLGWELGRRRRVLGAARRQSGSWVLLGLGMLVVVPAIVYAVTWTPWFVAFDNTYMASGPCANEDDDLDCEGVGGRVGALADYHRRMVDFHLDLDAEHAYRAPATGWPIQYRPVVYLYQTCSDDRLNRVPQTDSDGEVTTPEPCSVPQGSAAEIMSLGNPATWWLLVAGLPLLGAALRRRSRGSWFIVTFIALQFVPWLWASRPVFNFYTVPLVPFVALAMALAADEVNSWRRAWVPWAAGATTGALVPLVALLVTAVGDVAIDWVTTWYLAGIGALLTGLLVGTDTSGVTARVTPGTPGVVEVGDTARIWPLVTVAVTVTAVGLWFLPVWWGVTMPTWLVRAHWWLPSWI
jgi:dolichyl-phosphate-mannose-protein mannosyltransferase